MKKTASALFIVAFVGVAFLVPTSWAVPHFALRTSSPEADATVTSVDAVVLTFSQVPQDGSVLIRLVDPAGDPVDVGELERDEEDGRTMSVDVPQALDPGAYSVLWRGIGDDGHVVRGTSASLSPPGADLLHIAIGAGLVIGIATGLIAAAGSDLFLGVALASEPFGTAFINAIRMVIIPLVMAVIFTGVARLGDPRKLGRLGGTTLAFFWATICRPS